MIAPQELKIGNITDKGIIKNFYESGIHIGLGKCYGFNEIEPIELTEEWLLKFGFESNNVSYKIDNDRFVFELYFYDAWNLNYVEKQKFGNGSVELSGYWRIHELQNLFFALTGEELTIKEKK